MSEFNVKIRQKVAEGDIAYINPVTKASLLIQDANNRLVKDTERGQWNGKTKIVTSATEPSLETDDQWHREI